jgi:hypothetical protein
MTADRTPCRVDDQRALFPRIRTWLRPGGYFLAIVGAQRWTGVGDYMGAPMFWDHADGATYLDWLDQADLRRCGAGSSPKAKPVTPWCWPGQLRDRPPGHRGGVTLRSVTIARRWRCAALIAVLTTTLGCTATSSGAAHSLGQAFPTGPSRLKITFQGKVGEVEDFGVPTFDNISHAPVWLTSIEPVSVPQFAHVDSIEAYQFNQAGGGVITDAGDLAKLHPTHFVDHPISDVEVIPHHIPVWFVVIAMTWSQPVSHFALPMLEVHYRNAQGAEGQQQLVWPISGKIL